jgi:hypothetical protein
MAIKKQDGTVYQLSSPNPLTKDQIWEKDYILHNFNWDNIVIEEAIQKPIIVKETILEPPRASEPIPEPVVPPPPELTIVNREQEKQRTIKNVIIFHCLPTISDNSDQYNTKFDFEGVFVKKSDLETIIWTNIKINKGSIIYPSRYADGVAKFSEYRWWRISDILPKANGYLMRMVISEICPNFDD